jgi:hypothetical protein
MEEKVRELKEKRKGGGEREREGDSHHDNKTLHWYRSKPADKDIEDKNKNNRESLPTL